MVLKFHTPGAPKGQSILKVASHFASVSAGERVTDLADDFSAHPQIMAVAVTDPQGSPLGVISRNGLFSLLGRAYGRDVLGRKTAAQIMEEVPRFDQGDNLFHVAEGLNEVLDKTQVTYYLVTDSHGGFQGLFSSQDLLLYLSQVVQQDIEMAGQLQDRMMSGSLDTVLGQSGRVRGFTYYAKGVGGDFYQVQKVGRDLWFLTLCDVSGKGVAASFMTALLWGLIRMYDFSAGLKTLVTRINAALIQTFHLEKYITGYFMTFQESSGKVIWADLGHSHALIKRGGKAVPLRGERMNLPLGLDPELEPRLYSTVLKPGEEIVLFTDGVVEQLGGLGQEYGEERLGRLLESSPDFLEDLRRDFLEFKGNRGLHDDTTVLNLCFTGAKLPQDMVSS